ncbi:MAG TPA: hypothetical protein VG900_04055 [Hyphomicrobiaceae bacterium]|nr:hypothetical protein [Hyphomicrobiaceae bacterium]
MRSVTFPAFVAFIGLSGFATGAFAQTGPVATSCAKDIAKFCSGKRHDGSIRICLESKYAILSGACKKALDTTGGGRGKQLGGTKK